MFKAEPIRLRAIIVHLALFNLITFVGLLTHSFERLRVTSAGENLLVSFPAPLFQGLPGVPENWLKLGLWLGIVLVLFCAIAAKKNWWFLALASFLLITTFRVYVYFRDYLSFEVFHHTHIFFSICLLLLPKKLSGMRISTCLLYWASAVEKISPSWLFGDYFLSVPGGLPLVPDQPAAIMLCCRAVILLELVGPFFLLFGNAKLRRVALVAFLFFHLYSILLIGPIYPILMIPTLILLFGWAPESYTCGLLKKNIPAWLFGGAALLCSQWSFFIPGAKAITQEGRTSGLFMFDINSGCKVEIQIQNERDFFFIEQSAGFRDGWRAEQKTKVSVDHPFSALKLKNLLYSNQEPLRDGARHVIYDPRIACSATRRICCDPYVYHSYVRALKRAQPNLRVGLKIQVAANQFPGWFTLIEENDFQPDSQPYRLWRHNSWIRLPGSSFPAAFHWP